MKKLLLISVASFMTLAGWSQSKINPEGLMEIRQYKIDAGLIQGGGKACHKQSDRRAANKSGGDS